MNWKPLLLALAWLPGLAQTYSGPKPPKQDVPYLLQAGKLIPVESTQAKEDDRKEGPVFVIDGAASPVKTPMAMPIFLFDSGSLAPQSLELYKLDVNGDHREVSTGGTKKRKNAARPIKLSITQLDTHLYRVESYESLDPGEYSLSPNSSNQAFCFAVY